MGAIHGVPELKPESGSVCCPFQVGKQNKMFHKVVQHLMTTWILELLYMDLMSPMQVKSAGGKRYVLVCFDGFSR